MAENNIIENLKKHGFNYISDLGSGGLF